MSAIWFIELSVAGFLCPVPTCKPLSPVNVPAILLNLLFQTKQFSILAPNGVFSRVPSGRFTYAFEGKGFSQAHRRHCRPLLPVGRRHSSAGSGRAAKIQI